MALPTSGQISFDDFATEQALPTGQYQTIFSEASVYGVSFTTDGSNSIGMDEFYGREAPTYDLYNAITENGNTYYFVPSGGVNPFQSTLFGDCFTKAATSMKYGVIISTYPFAIFLPEAGPDCGEGAFTP